MPQYWGVPPGYTPSRALTQNMIEQWQQGHGAPGFEARQAATQAVAINEALRFMDPTTRGQFMRQLARDYPAVFGTAGYATAPTPPPPPGAAGRAYQQELLGRDRLSAAIQALTPAAVVGAASKGRRYSPALGLKQQFIGSEAQAPLGFLQDYLRTAQQAYGTGVGRATRAERGYAEQRLRELTEGAGQQYGLMAQLGQALVNPAMAKPPPSGGLGTGRAAMKPTRRNVALT